MGNKPPGQGPRLSRRAGQDAEIDVRGEVGFARRCQRILIIDTASCNVEPSTNKPAADPFLDHFVSFDIYPDHITGTFDGKLPLSRTDLNPPAPTTGYVGLTAAATNAVTAHIIKSIKVVSKRDHPYEPQPLKK